MTQAMDPQGASALSHLTVVDLTRHVAGPYCTKLLAGFGATVIKIERPGAGDPMRAVGPFYENEEGLERGVPFAWLNTGKRSVAIDLETESGRRALLDLARGADLLVESFPPRAMPSLRLGWQELREVNARLVMTSISNFGATGPRRDHRAAEITLQAAAGQMSLTGSPRREPLAAAVLVDQYSAGLWAYFGSLVALHAAAIAGVGQHLDVSIHECGIDNVEIALANQLHGGVTARRGKHPMVPWDLYPCSDGWAAVLCGPFRRWLEGAVMFEEPRLLDPGLRHVRERHHRREEVEDLIRPWLGRHTRREIFEAGQRHGLAYGYLADIEEAAGLPPHAEREFFEATEHPSTGRHLYPAAPFKMSETPWRQRRAPLLGEHTEEVLGGRPERAAPAAAAGPGPDRLLRSPLEGIRVLDLTHSWAAPHSTRMLADFGAEVIRIEYTRRLCMVRGGRLDDRMYDKHPMWFQVNRGKKSVTLDLQREEDREAFRDLVKLSDLVVDNARRGVMERLGLGYEDLRRIRPDVIVLSMAAFGRTGPWAARAGYGGTLEALGGINALTGYEGEARPSRIKEVDTVNGIVGACAAVTALAYRHRTGRGQWVDLSQLEGAMHALVGEHLLAFSMNGSRQGRMGNRHPRHAPQGCYPCAGEDRWVAISVTSDDAWRRLCEALGRPAWGSDPELATAPARRARHDVIDAWLREWTREKDAEQVEALLQRNGIAVAAVRDVAGVAADQHLRERGFFFDLPGSGALYAGVPIRFSGGGPRVRWRGPELGAHNDEILRGLRGRPDEPRRAIRDEDLGTAFDPE